MKKFDLTEEQVQALAIVGNLLDDLGLTSEKIDLEEAIDTEISLLNREAEDTEIYGFTDDDFYIGTSASEFLSELFGI